MTNNFSNSDDFDFDSFDFSKIRNYSYQKKIAMESFKAYLDSSINTVDIHMKKFIECSDKARNSALIHFTNIEKMSRGEVTRLCVILSDLSINNIKTVKTIINNDYSLKEHPIPPIKPDLNINNQKSDSTEDEIKQYQDYMTDTKNFNSKLENIIEYNQKVESIEESLFDLIDDGIFGDEKYDETDSSNEYIYFNFLEMDEMTIKSFIRSLWKAGGSIRVGRQLHQDVKKITIEDVTDTFSSLKKKSYEVRVHFSSMNDLQKFLSGKGYFLPIFEQFKMMTSGMNNAELGSLWGFDSDRNSSINIASFNNINIQETSSSSILCDVDDGGDGVVRVESYTASDLIMTHMIVDGKLEFCITPQHYFNNKGYVADFHFEVDGLTNIEDWGCLMESIFSYKDSDPKYLPEAIEYLNSIGIYYSIKLNNIFI